MDYEDLLDFVVNDESSGEFKLRQEKTADIVKRLDKQYDKYSLRFNRTWTDGKYYKRITVENYGSGLQGTLIRNAVTGVRYNIIVGSADEVSLFKVVDSTARNGRKEPVMLYYDSPEQYENHHFTTVNQNIKNKWHDRQVSIRRVL